MISRAIAARVPFVWFTAAYGQAEYLQAWKARTYYVMAIRCSDTLTTGTGEQRADALIAALQRLSTGDRSARTARVQLGCGSLSAADGNPAADIGC